MTNISANRVELWRAWQASRRVVVAALVITVLCGWSILLWHHPGWIIGFGSLLGLVLGVILGGMDILTGSEEFSLSLPPTRSRRYLVRAAFGGGVVLGLTGLSTLAIGLDLPQRLWGLVVESGFTEPFGPWEHGFLLYGLAITAPLLAFSATFATASLCRGPVRAALAWIPGLLAVAVVFAAGMGLEFLLWDWKVPLGCLCVPLTAAAAGAFLAAGKALYARKEGISRDRVGWGTAATVGIIIVVIVFLVVVLGLFLTVKSSSSEGRRMSELEMKATRPPMPPKPWVVHAETSPAPASQPGTTTPATAGAEKGE